MSSISTAVKYIRIESVPGGWIAKTHALWRGIQAARGTWVVLTDADIEFRPGVLRSALGACVGDRLDYLSVIPKVRRHTFLQKLLCDYLVMGIVSRSDLRMRIRKSDAGFGAFTMVRARTLLALGGLAVIKNDPVDDLALAELFNRSGARQGLFTTKTLLEFDWYVSAGAVIQGTEKNFFAVAAKCRYQAAALAAVGWCVYSCLTVAGLAGMAHGTAGVVWLACLFFAAQTLHRRTALDSWHVFLYPVAYPILAWGLLNSAWSFYRRKGIRWGDLSYSSSMIARRGI